jgi:hypothetical protein
VSTPVPAPPPPPPTEPAPPPPPPTDTPEPQVELPPAVMVNIWSEPATVKAGECTTVKAQVSGVAAAWLDDDPIVNNYGEKQDCPCVDSTHMLAYTFAKSEPSMHEWRKYTVHVKGVCPSLKLPIATGLHIVFPTETAAPTFNPHIVIPFKPFKPLLP